MGQIDIVEAVNNLAIEIVEKRKEQLRADNKRFIPRNFYASNIPECKRQMVHGILDWDKRELADDGLLSLFDSGKAEEKRIIQMLMSIGYDVIQQQNPISIKNKKGEIICSGKIDGKISYKGFYFPYEIKSMQDYTFQSIKSVEDFEKKPLLRKYLKQLQLYLYGNNIECGLFIISNFRQIKVIPVYLDYGLCEQILQTLESAWVYVQKKEYPEPITYNPQICDYCPFEMLCSKMTNNKPAEFINNEILEGQIARCIELKPLVKEYEELDEMIKAPFKEKEVLSAVIGTKYQIIGRKQKRISYDTKQLDEETKEKIKEEKEFVVIKYKEI